MARPQVLSFPWISKGFRALTFGLWRFEKQKAFSACPSPSKGLIGAFEEAVKGDPWRTGPTAADLASANYRTKVLERENTALRAALAEAVSLYGRPGGPWNVPSDPGGWLARARAALEAPALGRTTDAPARPDDLTILREQIIAEKDAQLAEAAKQLAAADAIIASDTKQIAEIHAMVERRMTELLASNNAMLERARRAEAALRPLADMAPYFDDTTYEDHRVFHGRQIGDDFRTLTAGHARDAARVIAQIEGSAP